MKRPLFFLAAVLAAAGLACSTSITLPRISTGPTETLTIEVPLPIDDSVADVTLMMGAGEFNLSGGAEGLAAGTIQYNVANWQPTITRDGSALTIEQSPPGGVNTYWGDDVVNDWTLRLGATPMDLTVRAGAYRGRMELGGLRLRSLEIIDGASQTDLTFGSPNPESMGELTYTTGASKATLTGLANANFEALYFKGGAGDYTLDFSGDLQQDATVTVSAGVGQLRVVVPSGTAARVSVTSGVGNITTEGPWSVNGSRYESSGEGPVLTIRIDMGVGNLILARQ